MLSWEAWRAPMTRSDALQGLDLETYTLSARAYTGAQRFLTDIVRRNPWRCDPVRLPDVDDALQLTLLTAALSGDAFARRTIGKLVAEGVVRAEGLGQPMPEAVQRAECPGMARKVSANNRARSGGSSPPVAKCQAAPRKCA